MNTALVLLPPQDRADLVPPPIEFLPISYSPFRFTSLSYPRYPAANTAAPVSFHYVGVCFGGCVVAYLLETECCNHVCLSNYLMDVAPVYCLHMTDEWS